MEWCDPSAERQRVTSGNISFARPSADSVRRSRSNCWRMDSRFMSGSLLASHLVQFVHRVPVARGGPGRKQLFERGVVQLGISISLRAMKISLFPQNPQFIGAAGEIA